MAAITALGPATLILDGEMCLFDQQLVSRFERLAQLEAGHKTNPSLPTLRKLAKALGVPVTELLG